MKKTVRVILFALLLSASVYYCVRYPREIAGAVIQSADRCMNVIIPSLFIFICLTSVAVSTGIHRIISFPFIPVARFVFRLKPEQFGIFVMSLVSGYPAGIKLLTDSFRKNEISKKEFERMSCFCFAGGSAFISGTVSGVLYPGTSAGTVCFISVTAGNIFCALLTAFFSDIPVKSPHTIRTDISAKSVTDSVLSSAYAVFQMCVMITAFGGIYRIAELSGVTYIVSGFVSDITGLRFIHAQAIVSSVFEISNIVDFPVGSTAILPVIAFLLSFGGICVLIQVMVISGGLLDVRKFLLSRLLSATVSAIVCRLISRFFDLGAVTVFRPETVHSGSSLTAVLLLIMTVMLLSLLSRVTQG